MLSPAKQPLPSRLFGANYILYSVLYGLAAAVTLVDIPAIRLSRVMLVMCLGPMLFFYYRSVLRPDILAGVKDLLHGLPSLLVVILLTSKSFLSIGVDFVIVVSFSAYLAAALVMFRRCSGGLTSLGEQGRQAKRWLASLLGLMVLNLIVEVSVFVEMFFGGNPKTSVIPIIGACVFLLANTFIIFLALKKVPIVEWMQKFGEVAVSGYKNYVLDDAKAEQIFALWDKTVLDGNLHMRDDGLSVKSAAKLLNLPSRHLSEAVNRVYGGSFSQHLNDLRIKHACSILQEDRSLSVTEVMLESGYATKSSFNKEFLRVMGMSPTQYKRTAGND